MIKYISVILLISRSSCNFSNKVVDDEMIQTHLNLKYIEVKTDIFNKRSMTNIMYYNLKFKNGNFNWKYCTDMNLRNCPIRGLHRLTKDSNFVYMSFYNQHGESGKQFKLYTFNDTIDLEIPKEHLVS